MTSFTDMQVAVSGMSEVEEAKAFLWLWRRLNQRAPTFIPSVTPPSPPFVGLGEIWWREKLVSGNLLPKYFQGWCWMLCINDLAEDYILWLDRSNYIERGGKEAMAKVLGRLVPGLRKGPKLGCQMAKYYTIPSLEACRAEFEAVHGKQDWNGEGADLLGL